MTCTINILDHNFCQLVNYPQSIKQLLSYQSKTYNRRQNKFSYQQHSLINFETDTTYTGLVDFISKNVNEIIINDDRIFPVLNYFEPELSIEPRDYQYDYLFESLKKQRCIVDSETGSGKTLMMALIIDTLRLPTLIIAPDKTMLGQLHTELSKLLFKRKPGDIGRVSGDYDEFNPNLTIGLTKSLDKIPIEVLKKFQVLLVDEAHKSAANLYHDLILSINAPYRYGFTGTPEGRSDNKDLIVQGLFGPIIKLIDRQQLEKEGFLAKIRIDIYRGWFEGDYHSLEDLLIVNNSKRNNLILKIVKSHKKETIIILVRKLEHGKILQDMIGKESIFISGEDSTENRESIRDEIKSGKYRVLIATKIFGTGLDIPQLEIGIDAKGGKSDIETKQGVGRVVRPFGDVAKKWIDIYDDYHPILEQHSKERIEAYKNKDIPINFIGFTESKENKLKEL
jgi:superfamily II DNA or RNA helicase